MIRTEEVICKWYYNQDSGVDVLRIQNQQFRLKNTENASDIFKITPIIYHKMSSDNY